jgi:hypothetical protein
MHASMVIEPLAASAPAEVCAACGRTIGELEQPFIWDQNVVCFGCHRDLSFAAASSETTDTSQVERVFLSDQHVHVTRNCAVFDGMSHNMEDVRFARVQKFAPGRAVAAATALIGLGIGVIGLNRHLDRLDLFLLIFGSAMWVMGIAIAIARRPRYLILIARHDVESVAFSSRKMKYARRIVDAIGEAIVERGQFVIPPPPPPTISRSANLRPTRNV